MLLLVPHLFRKEKKKKKKKKKTFLLLGTLLLNRLGSACLDRESFPILAGY